MNITKHVAPFECEGVLELIGKEFGEEEILLERPQLMGMEADYNTDVVLVAEEAGEVLGTIHATIPKISPKIAGLSAMVTAKSARGTGLGRRLFGEMISEMENMGVETMFLGTDNPIAKKLYGSFGFSYLFGSCVMLRSKDADIVDFNKKTYGKSPEKITVREGTAAIRIPIIPLVLARSGDVALALMEKKRILLDINTGIANCEILTQTSCMGLYPRYTALCEAGGKFFCAYDERGVLGAVASVIKTECGYRCDFFSADNYEGCIEPLVRACRDAFGEVYFEVANGDSKEALVKALGYSKAEETLYEIRGFLLPCAKYFKT